jgi:Leucine-rich repeat (LRR) protein
MELNNLEKHWRRIFYNITGEDADKMRQYLRVCGVFDERDWKNNVTHASHKITNDENPAYRAAQQVIKKIFYEQEDTLVLSDLLLTYIPTNIVTLTTLKTLFVNEVDVKTLFPGMAKLQNLETLVISKTPLQELPSWIGDMQKLKTLVVSRCRLSSIPREVGKLTAHTVDFSFNALTDVPDELLFMDTLERLTLSRNNISIAWKPNMLPYCMYLDVTETKVTNIPEYVVAGLVQLCWSDCGKIELRPDYNFGRRLKHLNLSGNMLKEIPESVGNLKQLEYLNISNNLVLDVPLSVHRLKLKTFLVNKSVH